MGLWNCYKHLPTMNEKVTEFNVFFFTIALNLGVLETRRAKILLHKLIHVSKETYFFNGISILCTWIESNKRKWCGMGTCSA